MLAVLVTAVFFASAGWAGALLSQIVCATREPLSDAPPSHPAPVPFLVAASGLIGGTLALHDVASWQLAIYALVCLALVACWCSDAEHGIVPDEFTLIPFALILVVAIGTRQWWFVASAAILLVPFATAAIVSKGYGLGWGDVKLAALGGLVLGAPAALLMFSVACLLAVIVGKLTRAKDVPIAFAPYLAAAIGIAIPLGVFV
jgi:prepilin signal peptidase PulO-like enzyme (type II secretory pathway)